MKLKPYSYRNAFYSKTLGPPIYNLMIYSSPLIPFETLKELLFS
jgi:hypothetical protein